ncbi:CCA tRNA nucleotidyltransferase [Agrobacterium vitis]|uniref:CCA tRNA nucleotidyltransferase n=1 Tax=Agrobacterium vitis TaxID=373 RepID=A0ABD6GGU9_AGRVI|nr:CCA tRNA nucleotidyltransferase [Agrobacterium vitis]MUO80093.1 CCA tRNA nucleotidyltransferase [Agrobacterium vitis]MUO97877.1 CCA tRNA nucleotidyltransferase [Agrobacterium vitis]MUP07999.1 CCA tRNA nucleotidyltransferase [Agrobacterium vitis]MUZ82529.1 CCA tRNA nucleotidyltransferase [Agrobacterium vitis]MVA09870.1 CCA tRNA nucleotidyltransferase [Agrobacterium vitis]
MTTVADRPWFQDAALAKVFALLNADGGEVRVVGGAVRNSLLGEPVGDIDLATTLVPSEVTARAEAAAIKAVPTGIEHGTVTLVIGGKPFEVTTLRRDMETDGRHAEVAFGTDWQVDAERRDFTINALYATASGEVIDPVGGLADLQTGTLRFIGDARLRIAEDYLRVLRFFRFFAWYGRGRPDADGLRACAAARDELHRLSAERVWSETKKLLSAQDPGRALLWMRQSGVLTAILPETEKWGIDAIPGLIATQTALNWQPEPLLRLAAMVPDNPERMKGLAERLKLSRAEAEFLQRFATAPKIKDDMADLALDRLLYRQDKPGIVAQLKLSLAAARAKAEGDTASMAASARWFRLLQRAQAFEKPVFPVTGSDAIAAGLAPGPEIGRVLTTLEDSWVQANFTFSREKLLSRLKEAVTPSG